MLLKREDERYCFALGQPYSHYRYEIYLEQLISNDFDYLVVETLAQTIQNRPLKVLTITDPRYGHYNTFLSIFYQCCCPDIKPKKPR